MGKNSHRPVETSLKRPILQRLEDTRRLRCGISGGADNIPRQSLMGFGKLAPTGIDDLARLAAFCDHLGPRTPQQRIGRREFTRVALRISVLHEADRGLFHYRFAFHWCCTMNGMVDYDKLPHDTGDKCRQYYPSNEFTRRRHRPPPDRAPPWGRAAARRCGSPRQSFRRAGISASRHISCGCDARLRAGDRRCWCAAP